MSEPEARVVIDIQPTADFRGKRFGRLLIVAYLHAEFRYYTKYPMRFDFWRARCDCGKMVSVSSVYLRRGSSQSCGCLRRDRHHAVVTSDAFRPKRTHGMCGSREYKAWARMHGRCLHDPRYAKIFVCKRWDKFENFLADMGHIPQGYRVSVDRIDGKKGYEPDNCRWATPLVQARNRSNNRLLTLDSKTQCISAWSEEVGIRTDVLRRRLLLGWSDHDALTKPVKYLTPRRNHERE